MSSSVADGPHGQATTWTPAATAALRRARRIAKAKERERNIAAKLEAPAAAPAVPSVPAAPAVHDRWTASLANAALDLSQPGLGLVWWVTGRLLYKAFWVTVIISLIVTAAGASGAWLWTKAGLIPGVQPALTILFGALMVPFGPHTAPAEDFVQVEKPQTDVDLSPYMLDMNRGIAYFSFFPCDGDTSGVATAVVEMALRENGLLGSVELAGTSKLSPIGTILLDVGKIGQDMDNQTHRLEGLMEETLTNVYREVWSLLQAMGNGKEQQLQEAMLWRWTKSTVTALGVPWNQLGCWLTGQTPAHVRLGKHMGRFERILADATAARQDIIDIFNEGGGGALVLSDMANMVQTTLCELEVVLKQAVNFGSHALLLAQKNTADHGGQLGDELAKGDVTAIEAAGRELRWTGAVGVTLCHQARQTKEGLTARYDAVLDMQWSLKLIKARLDKRRKVLEAAVRRDPCLDEGTAAEAEDDMRSMVEDFVKMLERAYVV